MIYFLWLITAGIVTWVVMFLLNLLPHDIAILLTDIKGDIWNPWSYLNVHAVIWVAFFYGFINLIWIWRGMHAQKLISAEPLLDADPDVIYERADRARIYRTALELPKSSFLRQMVLRSLAQYQLSRSWDRASQILQATTEEIQHRAELKYTLVRYLTWLIPSLGFIGTVIGIGNALSFIGTLSGVELANPETITMTVGRLGMAFSTTLMSLLLSSILIFAVSIWQSQEEELIADNYADCVDNLLNKLHEDEDTHGVQA